MRINLLAVFVATVLLSACEKKEHITEIITDPPVDAPMLITSITWADADSRSEHMEYNSDKTLKRLIQTNKKGDILYDARYSYENGRVVKAVDVLLPEVPPADVIYGQNGLPLKIYRPNNKVRHYDSLVYNAKGQPVISYAIDTSNAMWINERSEFTWEGNNIARVDRKLPSPDRTFTTLYSYDDKKSYFSGCRTWVALNPRIASAANVVEMRMLSVNKELLSLTKYRYEYNSKGYPIKVWKTEESFGQLLVSDSARIEYLQP